MPYPPEHRERTRKKILRSARALFNRHGFAQVKIDDVMEHAGLTHGGFYSYFKSKSELYAEAISLALWRGDGVVDGVNVDFSAGDAARQVIVEYLSREHADDVDGSCPMVTLPADVARGGDPVVRAAFEKVFTSMASLFAETLSREGRPNPNRALAIASVCVGAMVVARAMANEKLANSIREAARVTALELGGWTERQPRRKRPRRSARGEAALKPRTRGVH